MDTVATAPTTAQPELTLDLTTLTGPQLRESAEALWDDSYLLALAEDSGIAFDGNGTAAVVIDVETFRIFWGLPVTHARAVEVLREIKARDGNDDFKRDMRRGVERAEVWAEHGSSCDCERCWNTVAVLSLDDCDFRGGRR